MAPEELSPRINALIESSDLLEGAFSVEAALMLAATLAKNPKVRAGLAWSSLGYNVGARIFRRLKEYRAERENCYQIKVSQDDEIFDLISQWIIQDTPEEEQYLVEATRLYGRRGGDEIADSSPALATLLDKLAGDKPETGEGSAMYKNVSVEVDDDRPMILNVGHYELDVRYVTPGQEVTTHTGDGDSVSSKYKGEAHFVITCPNLEARRALLQKIDAAFTIETKRRPRVYRPNSWGEMDSAGDVPLRKLDTVILKDGQVETLIDDITLFLNSEKKYVDLGIPYHRGILLYGPPGTGKTSIAAAVSNSLDLDVFAVPLNSVRDDAALNNLLRAVRTRSVLLLEDVDTCDATRDKKDGLSKDGGGGVTLEGLLQALDGFSAPHGLVTIMTTNKLELIDPRLVRAGRADLKVEVSCVDTAQVERLCQRFIGYVPDGIPEISTSDMVSPAEVVGVFKAYLYDTQGAGPALIKRLYELLGTKNVVR